VIKLDWHRKQLYLPLGIFGLAVLLRLLHVAAIARSSPFLSILPGDAAAYDRWAQKIIAEGWLGKEVFYQDPLYSYFLALLYKIFGRSFAAIYTIQGVLDALTAVLVYFLGARSIGKGAGILGALLYALYAPAIYFSGLLLKETLASLLIVATVFCLLASQPFRPRPVLFLAGLFFGLAALTRANFLLLLPIAAVFILADRSLAVRLRLAAMGLLLLGAAAVLGPVALRNYVVGNDFVITTAQAGQNFYIGNNAQATGTYIGLPFVRPDPLYEREDFHREAEKRVGRTLRPSEASSYWFRQGVAFLTESPGAFLRLAWTKLLLFLNYYEIPDNYNFYFHQRYSPVTASSPVTFALVGPLFLLGLAFLIKAKGTAGRLLAAMQLTYIASVVAFYVFARYRIPLLPVFCLTAGHGLAALWELICRRQWRPAATGVLILAAAAGLVNHQLLKPFDFSHSFADQAIAYEMLGDTRQAIASYEEALRVNPSYVRAVERLARVQLRSGRLTEAKATYEQLLRLVPGSREARMQLMYLEKAGSKREALGN